jgi:hypothetical protein
MIIFLGTDIQKIQEGMPFWAIIKYIQIIRKLINRAALNPGVIKDLVYKDSIKMANMIRKWMITFQW